LAEEVDSKALERALERLRRERGLVETPTLAEFVEVSLGQHGGEPETVDKLRWLLAKGVPSPRSRLWLRPLGLHKCSIHSPRQRRSNRLLPNRSGMRVLRSKLTLPSSFNDSTIAAIQPHS
jgi:hypothetical protein